MKAIIYAGIGLFSVASVYGVIDYYGAKKQGVLNNLYTGQAEETPPAATTKAATTTSFNNTAVDVDAPPVKVEKKAVAAKERKTKKQKRSIQFKSFSRGQILEEIPVSERVPVPQPASAVAAAPVAVPAPAPAEQLVEKPVAKEILAPKPKIDMEMFSRAPLKRKVKKAAAQPEKIKEQ
jgi:hypothetical protein